MKFSKVVKTAIQWAPVVYPVIKKIMDIKKQSSTTRQK